MDIWSLTAISVVCMWNTVQTLTCPADKTPCSEGSRCILRHWICDGEQDCLDGSDERSCARCLPFRWMCADGNLCIREDWRCDGQADCPDGSDELSCASDATVLIADFAGPVIKINSSGNTLTELYDGHNGPDSIAYDRLLQHVYWSNIRTHKIQRVNLDGEQPTTVAEDIRRCQGMVIDHIYRFLFYSDFNDKTITKLDLKRNVSSVIVRYSTSSRPHEITADLKNKKLYWALLGEGPGIQMSDYDGRDRVTLLQDNVKPTSLTLASDGSTIFWIKEGKRSDDIMTLELANRTSSPLPYSGHGKFSDIDVLGNTLYLIDKNQKFVYLTLPATGGSPTINPVSKTLHPYPGTVKHIEVFASASACSHN